MMILSRKRDEHVKKKKHGDPVLLHGSEPFRPSFSPLLIYVKQQSRCPARRWYFVKVQPFRSYDVDTTVTETNQFQNLGYSFSSGLSFTMMSRMRLTSFSSTKGRPVHARSLKSLRIFGIVYDDSSNFWCFIPLHNFNFFVGSIPILMQCLIIQPTLLTWCLRRLDICLVMRLGFSLHLWTNVWPIDRKSLMT